VQTKAKVPGLSQKINITPSRRVMNQSMEIVKNNRNFSSDLRDDTKDYTI